MSGTRVYELSKELGVASKELVTFFQDGSFDVKSHMSVLNDEMIQAARKQFGKPEKADAKGTTKTTKKTESVKTEKKKTSPEKPKDKKTAEGASEKKSEKRQPQEAVSKEKDVEKASGTQATEARRPEKRKTEPVAEMKAKVKKTDGKVEPGERGVLELSWFITLRQLASKMECKTKDVMAKLKSKGVNAGANQIVEGKLVEEVAGDFGFLVEFVDYEHELLSELEKPDDIGSLKQRTPVVTLMGHVDHGKTSLLDKIRSSRITDRESGGITQHIGAYKISVGEKEVSFLDTPGHEAFTMMRARGADVTDIVILVVAAEEGLKPQTIEAIHHAQAAGVAIIVAINKVDKPEANPDRVKQQLLEQGLVVEDFGGDVIAVEVSAKSGQGIQELLEYITLVAEMLDLKSNPDTSARGSIVEARVDKGKGAVATVLIQNGTLRIGDVFTCGTTFGRVRAMFNDVGKAVAEAGPSDPVEILGFSDVPMAGDKFYVVPDEQVARDVAQAKKMKQDELSNIKPVKKFSLDELFQRMEDEEIKELPIILKCDVQGSVETIDALLQKLSTKKVKINVIHKGVGAVGENDVLLAAASNAIILGFHVRADRKTVKLAEQEGIEIRIHNIIYELTNEIRAAMLGMLDPDIKEEIVGHVEVRQVFKVPKIGLIAGCYVTDGLITRKGLVRVYRDNIMIHEGRLSSLKRFKDDASEVKQGFECGLGFDNFKDIREGDEIEVYVKKEVAATLD